MVSHVAMTISLFQMTLYIFRAILIPLISRPQEGNDEPEKIVDVHKNIIDYLGDIDMDKRKSRSDTKESDYLLNDNSLDLSYNTKIMSRANIF